jgi:short-subunit dehydrogenase
MSNRFFISGATGGLGKAFAVECGRRGWDLFLTDLDPIKLKVLSDGLNRSFSIESDFYPADLTNTQSRENLFTILEKENISFRGLINIAGRDFEGSFLDIDRQQLRTIIRLNIEATMEITHFLLSQASPLTPFRVITVASLAAFYPMPIKATYAASKRFLLNFSLALREEVREHNASVTVLCPAGLPTTQSTIESIEAQGFMGQLTTLDIGKVASLTLDASMRGKAVVIPGFLNRMLMFAGNLIPSASLARFIHHRWLVAKK